LSNKLPVIGCWAVLILLTILVGKFVNETNNHKAEQDAKKSAIPRFSADFNGLAQQIEQNEPIVRKVDRYAESSQFSPDDPLNPFFTIGLKPNATCTQATNVAKKYYPLLIEMREKYLPTEEAQSCEIDVNNDVDLNMLSINSEGIHEGPNCGN